MRRLVVLITMGLCSTGLGCSSSSSTAESEPAKAKAKIEIEAPEPAEAEGPRKARAPRVDFAARSPKVGEPAPAIALTSLAGDRVELPGANDDRAAVLIFGSFS